MKLSSAVTVGLLACTFASIAPRASAALFQCCNNVQRWTASNPPNITIQADPSHYPSTGTYFARVQEAAGAWQNLRESNITISVVGDPDGHSPNNSQSELYDVSGAISTQDDSGQSALAITLRHYAGGIDTCSGPGLCTVRTWDAADIVFFSQNRPTPGSPLTTIPWSSTLVFGITTDPFESGPIYFLPTALHEFGHLLGLEHSGAPYGMATMVPTYPFGGWEYNGTYHPFVSEQVEANALYPVSDPYSDVYVANVTHDTPKARPLSVDVTTDDTTFYPRNITGTLPTNAVHPNGQFQLRYCRGNMGPSSGGNQTVTAYLSLDKVWSSNDIAAGTNIDLGVHGYRQGCDILTFKVPLTAPTGNYWILVGPGTAGNDIGRQNRQLIVN